MVVSVFGQTDVGLVRENNEDSFLVGDLSEDLFFSNISSNSEREVIELTEQMRVDLFFSSISSNPGSGAPLTHAVGKKGSLFVVADGMGGAASGEIASRMAVELIFKYLRKRSFSGQNDFARYLRNSIELANVAIYEASQTNKEHRGMGTTLTAAGVYDRFVFFAQVGDSRGYLIRNGSIAQMTEDQSLVAHLVAAGSLKPEEARVHPQRNIVLQALGVQKKVKPVVSFVELRRDDWILLCSDGLSGKVEPEELKEAASACLEPKEACEKMIATARARGGEDNITIIAAKFGGEKLPVASPEDVPAYQEFTEQQRKRFWLWGKR